MADVAALLQTMHAMREPPPPAPVTPFLAMLALGCLAALGLAIAAVVAARRRSGLRRLAEAELAATRELVRAERLAAQARLLRGLVRTLGGDEAARRRGGAWLTTLDETFATRFFTEGQGRIYGDALYRPQAEADVDALDRALAGLIGRMRPTAPQPNRADDARVAA